MRLTRNINLALIILFFFCSACSQSVVLLHPPYHHIFYSVEHPEGEIMELGDALGRDCIIGYVPGENEGFTQMYSNDGLQNKDWYGWQHKVYAPISGIVEKITVNSTENLPGHMSKIPASSIVFLHPDGLRVLYGHVADIQVSTGDTVTEGDFVSRVGNNGYSRQPHIHVGAWKNKTPLQIQFNLKVLGKFLKENEVLFYQ